MNCLAETLLEVLNHPAESWMMGINGRSLAEKEYSADAVTRKLIQAYNAVAN